MEISIAYQELSSLPWLFSNVVIMRERERVGMQQDSRDSS